MHAKHFVQYQTYGYELNTWKLPYNTIIFQADDQVFFAPIVMLTPEMKNFYL